MQKEWSSFRITLILYLVVLILPFSFYFVYTSFKTMQHDTKIVRQSSWTAGAMEHLAVNPADQNNQHMIERIDKTLHEISLWVTKNSNSKLYIGAQTLSKDFLQVNACWTTYKENFSKHNDTNIRQHSNQCYGLVDDLAIIIEKMVYLKQNKIINIFYLSLALAMIFALLIIYMVRTYIYIQMKKHAIHDHETKLFNQKYFNAVLKTSTARSQRYKDPLSMLFITIANFGKGDTTYDKKTKKHILETFSDLIRSTVRTSDIACRYDEDHFAIIVPDSEKHNTELLESRLRQALEENNFGVSPELKFDYATAQFDNKETVEAFIIRTQNLLN